MFEEIGKQLLQAFIQFAVPTLTTALVSVAVVALNTWRQRMQADGKLNEREKYEDRIAQLALFVVTDLHTTVRPEIDKAIADGKVDASERANLRRKAIDWVLNQLGPEGQQAVLDLFGIGLKQLEDLIGAQVETRLLALKRGLSSK